MKHLLALSFTLAALTATSAFAVTQGPTAIHQTVATSAAQPADAQTPSAEKNSAIVLPRTGLQGDIYVADNRAEFGSRYQRY